MPKRRRLGHNTIVLSPSKFVPIQNFAYILCISQHHRWNTFVACTRYKNDLTSKKRRCNAHVVLNLVLKTHTNPSASYQSLVSRIENLWHMWGHNIILVHQVNFMFLLLLPRRKVTIRIITIFKAFSRSFIWAGWSSYFNTLVFIHVVHIVW